MPAFVVLGALVSLRALQWPLTLNPLPLAGRGLRVRGRKTRHAEPVDASLLRRP
jgi:hypothetical protein